MVHLVLPYPSFCLSRMVQLLIETLVGVWKSKCLKMPILAYVWWSRDAPVRSGSFETGLNIPGTDFKKKKLNVWTIWAVITVKVGFWIMTAQGRARSVWFFTWLTPHYNDLSSVHRAFLTLSQRILSILSSVFKEDIKVVFETGHFSDLQPYV